MATTTKRRPSRTPRSVTKHLQPKTLFDKATDPLVALIGLFTASFTAKWVQSFLGKSEATAGLAGVSDWAVPVGYLVAGGILPSYLKYGSANRYGKAFANGFAMFGGAKLIKQTLGKDMLAGRRLGYVPPVYTEPKIVGGGLPLSLPAYGNQTAFSGNSL